MAATVFAVEDHSAQVVVHDDEGTRVLDVDGLDAGTRQRVAADGQPVDVTTLAPPPGRLLSRIATLSDLHLGARHHFGIRDEPGTTVPFPLRCARAAVQESLAWGAEALVLKGDLTQHSRPDEWEQLAMLLDEIPVPVALLIGNHETIRRPHAIDPRKALADIGRPYDDVSWLDVTGARVLLVDTAVPGRGYGRLRHVHADAVRAAADATTPVIAMSHHHLERSPVPFAYPFGVPAPAALRFLRALRDANPALFVTSGHSHRHRARMHGDVPLTQVGSVKDFPGVWAGYAIHEGGIRQVVRRVAQPDCVRFTERTGRSLLGVWGRWTPGRLSDRCLVHLWPAGSVPGRRLAH